METDVDIVDTEESSVSILITRPFAVFHRVSMTC